MRKLLKIFTSRPFSVAVLILLQLFFMMSLVYQAGSLNQTLNLFFMVLSYLMVVYVINKQGNPSFKLAWCILILILPIFGGVLYLLFGNKKVPGALQKTMLNSMQQAMPLLSQSPEILENLAKTNPVAYKQSSYLWNNIYFPVYQNTETTYFKLGEEKHEQLLIELKKAKSFIFMEYFIVANGEFWNSVLDILEQKVKEGVLVRFMYDDAGCFTTLPPHFKSQMIAKGIECAVFNPIKARLVVQMNNRDHRKITVIDNRVGFVGGINLADEYINKIERFGHWKDTAVMLKGDAVWSLTVTFLQFWSYVDNEVNVDYLKYKLPIEDNVISDGFVQPFSDTPTDNEEAGLNVHMNMINNAKRYIYIQTPYLVIGYEMQKALTLAAKSGIDVRIVCPYVADKWYVHWVTQSNYQELINAGVKIYEYEPGFIHSKAIVCDDEIGFCGTINMDFRSYYLNYECGVVMYNCKSLLTMKNDFLTMLTVCVEITQEKCKNVFILKKLAFLILNLFAPLI